MSSKVDWGGIWSEEGFFKVTLARENEKCVLWSCRSTDRHAAGSGFWAGGQLKQVQRDPCGHCLVRDAADHWEVPQELRDASCPLTPGSHFKSKSRCPRILSL